MKLITGLAAVAALASAQDIIGVKSGLIHYVEGNVWVNEKKQEPVKSDRLFALPPDVKAGQILRTEDGRAEVLLSPGVILRVGEDSAIRMESTAPVDTRLELTSGVIVLEVAEQVKGNVVTVSYGGQRIVPKREGVYRIGGSVPELRVYDGVAEVTHGKLRQQFKRGRVVPLLDWKLAKKFDTNAGDSLVRWSVQRSEYLALASKSAAGAMVDQRRGWRTSMWRWNPHYGIYAFIPGNTGYCSVFGYCYYTPQSYYSTFIAPPVYQPSDSGRNSDWGGGGYNASAGGVTSSQRSYDPGPVSSAPSSAPAASVDTSSRGGESAGSRGGEGGGRSQ